MPKAVRVALPLPINQTFDYFIPPHIKHITPGQRVLVEFNKRYVHGYVLEIVNSDTKALKPFVALLEDTSYVDEHRLALAKWISEYYFCSLGEALRLFYPVAPKVSVRKTLVSKADKTLYPKQKLPARKETELLSKGEIEIRYEAQVSNFRLDRDIVLEYNGEPVKVSELVKRGLNSEQLKQELIDGALSIYAPPKHTHYSLTPEQEAVYNAVVEDLSEGQFKTHLLFGITGSGKTEVYLQLIDAALQRGLSAICIVPEISLTPQMLQRFQERFGNNVAILHSALSNFMRWYMWHEVAIGRRRVVLGARSALFAPVQRLGLIIVDEEHEQSYKQSDKPRYNARDLAIYMAKYYNVPILLGSATPRVESFFSAERGKFVLHKLTKRIGTAVLPEIRVVDLREKLYKEVLSDEAIQAIEERLERKEQIIIFHNRRGFSNFLMCKSCGHTFRCPHCDVTFTYHKRGNKLLCHWCGAVAAVPQKCPICGSTHIERYGVGTQRLEDELQMHFPEAVVQRMDLDTTRRKGSYERILRDFGKGKIDILLGTQMVTKGFDFPNVTLVIIAAADVLLNFPDFRSPERAFQLLTQVSGRAGRRNKKGEVIIQTYNPEHYSVIHAVKSDYEAFYREELEKRRKHMYPPYSRYILIYFEGKNYSKVEAEAEGFYDILIKNKAGGGLEISPPTLPLVSKIQDRYRFVIVLKGKNVRNMHLTLRKTLTSFSPKFSELKIDVDPIAVI